MVKKQNCVIWIQTLCFIVYIKTDDIQKTLILQFKNGRDHYLKEKIKVNRLIKDELGGKIMTKFVGLRAKTYGYLKDDHREDKKQQTQKKVSLHKNLNLNIIKTI